MIDNPRSTVRFLSYNILNGGLGRLDPIYETLLFLNADVVGLVEADDAGAVAYLAAKLGYDHVMAESGAEKYHLALLSRLPIHNMVNLTLLCPELSRSALEAEIQTPSGQMLRVALVHLLSGTTLAMEERRMRELEPLLTALQGRSGPCVMMGDFNSNAPYHPFDAAAARPSIQAAVKAQGGVVPHQVVERLLKDGWVDAYHRIHPDDPRHSLSTGYPAQRVDYIWVTPDLADRVAGADIEQAGFAPYCSDHFPIWADLRLD